MEFSGPRRTKDITDRGGASPSRSIKSLPRQKPRAHRSAAPKGPEKRLKGSIRRFLPAGHAASKAVNSSKTAARRLRAGPAYCRRGSSAAEKGEQRYDRAGQGPGLPVRNARRHRCSDAKRVGTSPERAPLQQRRRGASVRFLSARRRMSAWESCLQAPAPALPRQACCLLKGKIEKEPALRLRALA